MKTMQDLKHYSIFIVCLFLLFLWGTTVQADPGNDDTDVLVVGVPADRCPVFYIDPETKETVGIGVDLMRAAA